MGRKKTSVTKKRVLNFISTTPRAISWTLVLATAINCTWNEAKAQLHNSAVSAAMGGVGLAAVETEDALFKNPASIARTFGYNMSFNYSSANAELLPQSSWGMTISDNTPQSIFSAALGYQSFSIKQAGEDIEQSILRLGLANFISEKLSFGLGVSLFNGEQEGQNVDLGFLLVPTANVGVGFAAYNLVNLEGEKPLPGMEKAFGLGAQYLYADFFRVMGELVHQSEAGHSIYKLGLESILQTFLRFRLGYQVNEALDNDIISTGLGFSGPRFRLNYALEALEPSEHRHQVDLVLPF